MTHLIVPPSPPGTDIDAESGAIPDSIARDIAAIARIEAVPALLRVIADFTGLGLVVIARVTADSWTACAVLDRIGTNTDVGTQIALESTLCKETRLTGEPVVIDHASQDPAWCNHPIPRIYGFESYISVAIRRKDGSYFGNLCAIDPKPALVSDERTLAMFRLFSELIALQLDNEDRHEATEKELEKERSVAELREQFIAVLGHDLINPLTSVLAAAEQLAQRKTHPDLVTMGHRLQSASNRMLSLIDDVLDFAKGRLGNGIGISVAPVVNLAAAFRNVVDELRAAHPKRLVADHIAIDGTVRCDVGRMQQLLANLLSNALTYGSVDGPVEVDARLVGNDLVLTVTNGGEPIAPADLGRIFEPYWRPTVAKSASRPANGLGLGLFICAEIVRAHGGTLDVRSSAEEGTRFVATLPVAAER